jgi:hypothetical protein
MERPDSRDQRQQEAGGGHPIAGQPAAGLFAEAFRKALPTGLVIIETLFRKGIRLIQAPAPG